MRALHYQSITVIVLLVAGWIVMAEGGSPETDLAAPGAPLYEKTVKESVVTLMSKEEQAKLDTAGRPPSPGPEYYWCENCKTYHQRKTPASVQTPAAAHQPGTAPAASAQTNTVAAVRPPSPGPDYYWCENCKTYHRRQQPNAAVPQAHTPPPAIGSAQSPGGNYYYCEKCKTYHRRQPIAQQSVEDLIVGGVSNSPNRNPLIAP